MIFKKTLNSFYFKINNCSNFSSKLSPFLFQLKIKNPQKPALNKKINTQTHMNFVFILDTSISMMQAPNNQMTLLGMAKNGIEFITKCRSRFPESKYDHYHLITTSISDQNVISSWEHDFSHFLFQLKNITYSLYLLKKFFLKNVNL